MAFWDPWYGCHKFSTGCLNCYIHRREENAAGMPTTRVTRTDNFDIPVRRLRNGTYKIKSGTVWTCFRADFFVKDADRWRDEAWDIVRERGDLHFFMITKRIHRLAECLPGDWGDGWDNVTVACTMEDQAAVELRMPLYKSAPLKHRIVVCEPLLGPIDLSGWLDRDIRQVVCGGESGWNARECRYQWILSLREQCLQNGIKFKFRQTGSRFVKDGVLYKINPRMQFRQARQAGIDIE